MMLTMKVDEPITSLKAFMWSNPDMDQWNSIFIDGERPAKVPESEIHYLRERYGESGIHELTASRFRSGQAVRAISGVWRDNVGVFEAMGTGDRVRVLFEMMGRAVPVELGERELAAA